MSRNERRVRKYRSLIMVGFTRTEATKYKDRADDIVEALCELKKRKDHELSTELEMILTRKGSK